MLKSSDKILVLKLGGQCNLHCSHCHCKRVDFKFNPDIIKYIKDNHFTRITFSGGEPLLYWQYIKQIIDIFKRDMQYKIVTNATLLNTDIVNTLNEYNVHVGISFDGDNHSRDYTVIPKAMLVKQLKNKSLVTLYSEDNEDIDKLIQDINKCKCRYEIKESNNHWLNFVHQTGLNPNEKITRNIARNYCLYIANKLELDFLNYRMRGFSINECSMLVMCFNKWIRKRNVRGIKCCNEQTIVMTISGKFLLCPYDEQYVGDIYTGIDWNKVESYIPDRCKKCDLWQSCMNTCIANITDNECYISKVIHRHFYKLMAKYNVSYEKLEQIIGR